MDSTNTFIYTMSSIIEFKNSLARDEFVEHLKAFRATDQNGNKSSIEFEKLGGFSGFLYGNFDRYLRPSDGFRFAEVPYIGHVVQKYAANDFSITYRTIRSETIHEATSIIDVNTGKWINTTRSFDIGKQIVPTLSKEQYTEIFSNTVKFNKFIKFFI